MLYLKDHICIAERAYCEDAIGWGDHYLFAMDGASGLSGSKLMGTGSDAEWFADSVRNALCRELDQCDNRSVEEILLKITDDLRKEYEKRAEELGVELPPDVPSAGIALFRENGDELEFFGLGDCVGVVELTDGTLVWQSDLRLPELDGIVTAKMAELHRETGISVLEARKQCNDLLLKHRQLYNTPDGYWILDPTGKGIPHAMKGHWKINQVRSISAFSDGFAWLVEAFGLYENYGALHQKLTKTPLRELVDQLFTAQEQDPDANRYPRLKFRDDTCALWAEAAT